MNLGKDELVYLFLEIHVFSWWNKNTCCEFFKCENFALLLCFIDWNLSWISYLLVRGCFPEGGSCCPVICDSVCVSDPITSFFSTRRSKCLCRLCFANSAWELESSKNRFCWAWDEQATELIMCEIGVSGKRQVVQLVGNGRLKWIEAEWIYGRWKDTFRLIRLNSRLAGLVQILID
jgi:hypothetical protein